MNAETIKNVYRLWRLLDRKYTVRASRLESEVKGGVKLLPTVEKTFGVTIKSAGDHGTRFHMNETSAKAPKVKAAKAPAKKAAPAKKPAAKKVAKKTVAPKSGHGTPAPAAAAA